MKEHASGVQNMRRLKSLINGLHKYGQLGSLAEPARKYDTSFDNPNMEILESEKEFDSNSFWHGVNCFHGYQNPGT